jgi:hypothetical protein
VPWWRVLLRRRRQIVYRYARQMLWKGFTPLQQLLYLLRSSGEIAVLMTAGAVRRIRWSAVLAIFPPFRDYFP